jgi:hypothetical protein
MGDIAFRPGFVRQGRYIAPRQLALAPVTADHTATDESLRYTADQQSAPAAAEGHRLSTRGLP